MKLAVVLIDMQGYYVAKLPPGEARRIIPKQIEVLRYCQERQIPVLIITNSKRDANIPALAAMLDKVPHYDISRIWDLAIGPHTQFEPIIKKLGITHVFFMGINGNICVRINLANAQFLLKCQVIISPEVISGPAEHDDPLPYYRKVCQPYFETIQDFFAWTDAQLAPA